MRIRLRLFSGDNPSWSKILEAIAEVRAVHPGEDVIVSVETAQNFTGVTREAATRRLGTIPRTHPVQWGGPPDGD